MIHLKEKHQTFKIDFFKKFPAKLIPGTQHYFNSNLRIFFFEISMIKIEGCLYDDCLLIGVCNLGC